jgi:molybdate transport system substrate-binding protein
MKKVTDAGGATGDPTTFAKNRLQIVVGNGNPKQVKGLDDLANRTDLTLAFCAPQVPCGSYATKAFQQAGLTMPEASQEQNVRAVVDKVGLGEADAGIGYTTDVKARDADVDGVDIPDAQNVIATYPQAVLKEAENPAGAAAWNAYVLSAEGQAALAAAGFLKP